MSDNRIELEQQLIDGDISDIGRVALALEHLVDKLEHVAYGAPEYPGAIERISMKLEEVAGAISIAGSSDDF